MIELSEIGNIDPSIISAPTFEHLEGVHVIGNIMVDLDKIHYDEENNNIRYEGQDPAHVESLVSSFSEGVDRFEFPFGITERKFTSTQKTHDLIYGFGRFAALKQLGVKKYPATLLEFDNLTQVEDVKAAENETYPKSPNKEIDLKFFIKKKIDNGWLKNEEDEIRKELKRVCVFRKKQSIDRIVQMVFADCKTPQKYQFYTPAKAQQWLDNHSSEDYIIGGFDDKKDMFGYLVKEGYQYRFVMNAIRNYAQYGKKSYCIVHVGSPSGKSTIHTKRKQFIEELNQITKNFLVVSNEGIIAWEIMGFLPQIFGQEDWKKLIKIV